MDGNPKDKNPEVGVPKAAQVDNVNTPPTRDNDQGVVKKFPENNKHMKILPYIVGVLVILAGGGTGYAISRVSARDAGGVPGNQSAAGVEVGDEAGIQDEDTFNSNAEGVLVEGGFDGEGTHHLERGAGENKNVYLTSSVIDLDSFVGKKVQVWGQTVAAQAAPWLMDVGRVKIVE